MPDRRESAWQDPRTWVSILGVMLMLLLTTLGYIVSVLTSINTSVQQTGTAVTIVTTKQEMDSKSFSDRIVKLENAVTTQQQAYNYNMTTRLANVEAKLSVKSTPKEE